MYGYEAISTICIAAAFGTGLCGGACLAKICPGRALLAGLTLGGFGGGLLLAFTCFSFLPITFVQLPLAVSVVGILCGMAVIMALEAKTDHSNVAHWISIQTFWASAAALQLFLINQKNGVLFCIILMLQSVPAGIYMRNKKMGRSVWIGLFFMQLMGALLGLLFFLTGGAPLIYAVLGGGLLYIASSNIFPEQEENLYITITAAGALPGFVFGVMLMYQ